MCAFNPLPSDSRLRCCDRYIRCHRLLAVKLLSPREHAGRRVGKGGTLGSVHTASSDPCPSCSPWSRVTVAAKDNRSLHVQTSGAGSISSFRNRIIITTHRVKRWRTFRLGYHLVAFVVSWYFRYTSPPLHAIICCQRQLPQSPAVMRWDRRTIKRFLSLCLLSH